MIKLSLNINKCIELDKDQRRKARVDRFAQLDTAFMQTLERGDTDAQALVVEAKQELRDITKDHHYSHCATLKEVCDCWPEDLLGPCPYHQPQDHD